MRSPIHDIIVHVSVGARERPSVLVIGYFIFGDFKPRVRERERERESLEVPITEIIYFQTYCKTNMLNIKIFKTASSYSDTAVIHRY